MTAREVAALVKKVAQLEAQLAQAQAQPTGVQQQVQDVGEQQERGEPSALTSPMRIKPASFAASPGESWLTWVRKFKSIAELNRWPEDVRLQVLPAYLDGLAEQTFYSLTTEECST